MTGCRIQLRSPVVVDSRHLFDTRSLNDVPLFIPDRLERGIALRDGEDDIPTESVELDHRPDIQLEPFDPRGQIAHETASESELPALNAQKEQRCHVERQQWGTARAEGQATRGDNGEAGGIDADGETGRDAEDLGVIEPEGTHARRHHRQATRPNDLVNVQELLAIVVHFNAGVARDRLQQSHRRVVTIQDVVTRLAPVGRSNEDLAVLNHGQPATCLRCVAQVEHIEIARRQDEWIARGQPLTCGHAKVNLLIYPGGIHGQGEARLKD